MAKSGQNGLNGFVYILRSHFKTTILKQCNRSFCSPISPVEIKPEKWSSMVEILDRDLEGDENQAEAKDLLVHARKTLMKTNSIHVFKFNISWKSLT